MQINCDKKSAEYLCGPYLKMPGHFTFFTQQISEGIARFEESEYRHAIVSLRYQVGDAVQFTDGKGNQYSGTIQKTDKKGNFTCSVDDCVFVPKKAGISLAVGIIKSTDRMEWMVEKCTELGVSQMLLVKTTTSERSKLNLEKLRKTAIAALKQSHNCWLPELVEATWQELMQWKSLPKFIAVIGDYPTVKLEELSLQTSPDALFLVGPEGDFTAKEVTEAIKSGFTPLDMGKSILRTETAAVSLAAYMHLKCQL